MKTRINISIDTEVLEELDMMAAMAGVSRSAMIERIVKAPKLDVSKDRMSLIVDFARELKYNIDCEPDYENRKQAKIDSFYQLVGCIEYASHCEI